MIKVAAAWILCGLVALVALSEWFGVAWSKSVLLTACQPLGVQYNSFDPYCLQVIEVRRTLSSHHLLWLAKKGDLNYGHGLYFPTINVISPEEYERLKVRWSTLGVEVETMWGDRLLIPKENFIGGR